MRATLDFLLHDWLGIERLPVRPRFAEHRRETFAQVLDTCERIARDKFEPFYGGMLGLGGFMQPRSAALGWVIIAAGGVAAAIGVLLVVMRSRMGP